MFHDWTHCLHLELEIHSYYQVHYQRQCAQGSLAKKKKSGLVGHKQRGLSQQNERIRLGQIQRKSKHRIQQNLLHGMRGPQWSSTKKTLACWFKRMVPGQYSQPYLGYSWKASFSTLFQYLPMNGGGSCLQVLSRMVTEFLFLMDSGSNCLYICCLWGRKQFILHIQFTREVCSLIMFPFINTVIFLVT